MAIDPTSFPIRCTGDVCVGDVILFSEAVFGGSFRKSKFLGERRVAARVVRDSYGGAKQQHTFSIEVIGSDGIKPLASGTRTTRKGRNVYRSDCMRQPWADEIPPTLDAAGKIVAFGRESASRQAALSEKHRRGDTARAARATRREIDGPRW